MTKTDVEILNEVLNSGEGAQFESGTITIKEPAVESDPIKALQKFKDFGGEGWLITAGPKEPFIFPGASVPDGEWPIEGELAKGADSMRLCREGNAWVIVTLTEEQGKGVIKTVKYLAADQHRGKLKYRVAYSETPCTDETPAALRATVSRFAGFCK